MNLPNKLTVFRIILVPLMVVIPYLRIKGEFLGIPIEFIVIDLIFGLASLTDKLDGTLARKYNLVTTFGKFLDPIADKILVLTAFMILVDYGKIPVWIPIVVLFREFTVSGYRLIASQKGGKVIPASFWGKLKTATQMAAIIGCFLDRFTFLEFTYNAASMNILQYLINIIVAILLIVSVIATIFSGWNYIKEGKDLLKDN